MNPGGIRADFDAEQSSGGEVAGEVTYGEGSPSSRSTTW
jgi:5'-nucleotidase